MAKEKEKPDDSAALGTYRNRDITSTSAQITNAGGGLSASLQLAPVIYDGGDRMTIVIRTRVKAHRHIYDEDTGCYELVQTFQAGTMAVIDDDIVAEALDLQEKRLQEKKDEAAKQLSLPGTNGGRKGLAAVPDPAE